MKLCSECIGRTLEATKNWLEEGWDGGVVVHPHEHYDHQYRRECPGFVFHWGVEPTSPEDWDDDEEDE